MRKILLAFDGANFSEGAFEFARKLNMSDRILLTGIFLPRPTFVAIGLDLGGFESTDDVSDSQMVEQNVQRFETLCIINDIEFRVHEEPVDESITRLKKESRFADLVILGSESFYVKASASKLNSRLKDALHELECPVIVVPESYQFPEMNVIAYDGSASSVFAIRQFTYLMPELCKHPTLLLYVKQKNKESLPYEDDILELTSRHFPNLEVKKVDFDPKVYFSTWISSSKFPILVSGSFGRSLLSTAFNKSFVNDVLEDHLLPVFISHA
ncbi:MAG: hypothetical protein JWN76_2428 [Chitinophagaceae bacterium]|nr:hypothetical protein [Chitinophagaceae bacterium]